MKTQLLLLTLMVLSIGCSPEKETAYLAPQPVSWEFEIKRVDKDVSAVRTDMSRLEGRVDILKEMVMPTRELPAPTTVPVKSKDTKESNITLASLATAVKQDPGGLNTFIPEDDSEVSPGPSMLTPEEVQQMIKEALASQPAPERPDDFPTAASYAVQPRQTYTGPSTYGNARYAGSTTVTRTRKKAVTTYVDEPYEVSVPMMKVDEYRDVQETTQVPVQRTRYRTETRTRKKAVTTYVDEPYQVSVPETYTDYVSQTRTVRKKVGEKMVPQRSAPVSYSYQTRQPVIPVQPRYVLPEPTPVSSPVYDPCAQPAPVMAPAAPLQDPCAQLAEPRPVTAALNYSATPMIPMMQEYTAFDPSQLYSITSVAAPASPAAVAPKERRLFQGRLRERTAAMIQRQPAQPRPARHQNYTQTVEANNCVPLQGASL